MGGWVADGRRLAGAATTALPMPDPTAAPSPSTPLRATATQRRRLRAVWRSAGWPCRDPVEAELLAAGWLAVRVDAGGRETLVVTAAGVAVMAEGTAGHRAARDAHEALVVRVARALQREGRLVWRGLALRAGLAAVDVAVDAGVAVPALFPDDGVAAPAPRRRWVLAQPDLFSIRPSSRVDGLLPLAHEIKVHRADLLSDLRRPAKGAAYHALAGACWYVLREGIGEADEVPAPHGVLLARCDRFEVLRPPQRESRSLDLATWLALARAAPEPPPDEPDQATLGGRVGDAPGAPPD